MSIAAMYERERQAAATAELWYEVRYWHVLPEGAIGTPSQWMTIAFCASANNAAIVAGALRREHGWYCEIWSCNPVVDPDIPPVHPGPVAWHRIDTKPAYYERDYRRWEPGADPTR